MDPERRRQLEELSLPIRLQLPQLPRIDFDYSVSIGNQPLVGIAIRCVVAQVYRVAPLIPPAQRNFEIGVGKHPVVSNHT